MKKGLTILLLVSFADLALSQDQQRDSVMVNKIDSLAMAELSHLLSREDSVDIFELIDSLLKIQDYKPASQLALRLGYNSNIVSDNRTFNIEQFGLAPGVSYYHKSGLYADVTSYWSKEYEPNFYLSVASGGYLKSFTKWYSLLAEYSHYFYYQASDSVSSIPYTNNIGISNYFEFKKVVLRLDYYFYFGDKTAHRIMPSLGINLVKRKWAGLDRIAFYPNFNVLFGTEEITTYEFYPNLALRYLYNRTHTTKLPLTYEQRHTEFGVMNYSFSAPITLSKKDWTFMLNYTYNIPKSLPGEELTLQNSGYLSFSITKYFGF